MTIHTKLVPLADDATRAIGVITLDNPASLNAQNLLMVSMMHDTLTHWALDDSVVAVLMHGAGERAFCAGGDIRGLYHSFDDSQFPNPDAAAFFSTEYALCKQIKAYAKPIIVWASGIVMGGGMGLATAASHRIVTDSTLMAMPEVSIGLFPDAGGSYFLKQMPDKLGLFLGLTGARFNGADALMLGVADYAWASGDFDKLIDSLISADWQGDDTDRAMLNKLLDAKQPLPTGLLSPHWQMAADLMSVLSLADFDALARDGEARSDYINAALGTYRSGSATSAALTWRLAQMVDGLSFNEVMDIEYIVALHSADRGEFREGVRALLIDKDKSPAWRYQLDNMPDGWIDGFFIDWR